MSPEFEPLSSHSLAKRIGAAIALVFVAAVSMASIDPNVLATGFILASRYGFLMNNTDESTLLNTFLTNCATNVGPSTLMVDYGKAIRANSALSTPGNVGGTNNGACAIVGSANPGFSFVPGTWAGGTLDLRSTGGPKISVIHHGSFTLRDLTITTNGPQTDCDIFLQDNNSVLYIDNVQFNGGNQGTKSDGHHACNEAIRLGGTGTAPSYADLTGYFVGYGTVIQNSKFVSVKNVLVLQSSANSVVFQGNYINGGNLSSAGSAITLNGSGGGGGGTASYVRLGHFNNNLIEMGDGAGGTEYACGYTLSLSFGNTFSGNAFWDGPATSFGFCKANSFTPHPDHNTIDASNKSDGGSLLFDTNWADGINIVPSFLLSGTGANLSSGATITPTNEAHHVTGVGTIATIATTNINTNKAETITLIADGAWTWSNGGNIASPAIVAVATTPYTFVWSPSDSKWYGK